MKFLRGLGLCMVVSLTFAGTALSRELAPQRSRESVRFARTFLAGLESAGRCPVAVDVDPERAIGVVVRPDPYPFFLFVPQNEVDQIDFQGPAVGSGYGAPVGLLFGAGMGFPVVDGRVIDWQMLRHTLVQDPKAGKIYINCVVLTAGRNKEGVVVLHGFGIGERPIFSVPLEAVEKREASVIVKNLDVEALRLLLELSFANTRRAVIPFGAPPRP